MKKQFMRTAIALVAAILIGACSSPTSSHKKGTDGGTDGGNNNTGSGLVSAVTVASFESDTAGAAYDTYGYASTSFSATAANPSTGSTNGDTSAKVLQVQPTGYDAVPLFNVTLPTGTSLSDFGWIHVKFLAPTLGDNGYKSVLAFAGTTLTSSSGAKNTNSSYVGAVATAGQSDTAWNEYFIPIDSTVAATVTGTSIQVAVGISRNAVPTVTNDVGYYLDDISLIPKTTATQTFESDTVGAAYSTYGYSSTSFSAAAANPSTGSTNGDTTAKVLQVQPTGYDAVPLFSVTLPTGTSLSDFGWIHVKFLAPTLGDNGYKSVLAFAGTTLTGSSGAKNTNSSYVGAIATAGQSDTTWNEYFIPIDATVAATVTGTSIQVAVGISRNAVPTVTNDVGYYLDDVGLVAK